MTQKQLGYALLFLLIVAFVIGSLIKQDSYLLVTVDAPKGERSLQSNKEDFLQPKILSEWKNNVAIRYEFKENVKPVNINGLTVARHGIELDYFFIITYMLLFSMLTFLLKPNAWAKTWLFTLSILIIVAGTADLLENGYMIAAIDKFNDTPKETYGIYSGYIYNASSIKWLFVYTISLILVIRLFFTPFISVFFTKFSGLLSLTVSLLWEFRIQLLSLLIIFAAFWLSDQVQDLLLTLNTSVRGTILFIIVVTVSALLNWYFPKMIESYTDVNFGTFFLKPFAFAPNKSKVDVARLIGAITFLIPSVCILKAMQNFHILPAIVSPFIILLVITCCYYLALKNNWIENCYLKKDEESNFRVLNRGVFYATILIVVIVIAFFGILNYSHNRNPWYLLGISVDLWLLSYVFIVLSTLRTLIPSFNRFNVTPFLIGAGFIVFLIFLGCNVFAKYTAFDSDNRFLTFPVFYCAIIFYLFAFSVLMIIGKKNKVQIITMMLAAGLLVASWFPSTFHHIDIQKSSYAVAKRDTTRDTLPNYVRQWLTSRKCEIKQFADKNKDYPVFFINSYGGGIKAAAFTSMVIGELDTLVRLGYTTKTDTPRIFQDFVFAYAGASGGTLGLSVNYAARFNDLKYDRLDSSLSVRRCDSLYRNDYLTPELIGLMGRDIWMSAIAQNWFDDRQKLQEKAWEKHLANFGIPYNNLITNYWTLMGAKKYRLPLLFINTFDGASGRKAIISPVKLDTVNFPYVIFLHDTLHKPLETPHDLKLSTAAFLSARFPYVSPTGNLNDKYHFVDAGYNENSGSETLGGVIKVFQKELKKLQSESPAIFCHVKINIISINHGIIDDEGVQPSKAMSEITAPLAAALSNGDGNAYKAESISRTTAHVNSYNYFPIRPHHWRGNNKIWAVLPLGWQISDDALSEMHESVVHDDSLKSIVRLTQKQRR